MNVRQQDSKQNWICTKPTLDTIVRNSKKVKEDIDDLKNKKMSGKIFFFFFLSYFAFHASFFIGFLNRKF